MKLTTGMAKQLKTEININVLWTTKAFVIGIPKKLTKLTFLVREANGSIDS